MFGGGAHKVAVFRHEPQKRTRQAFELTAVQTGGVCVYVGGGHVWIFLSVVSAYLCASFTQSIKFN